MRVPQTRKLAKKYNDLSLNDAVELLHSPIHEERLLALLILVGQYQKGDEGLREKIFKLYLENIKYINNWDLVDLSAPHIVGGHLFTKNKSQLIEMAKSKLLWEKRIAILSTLFFTKNNRFQETIRISRILLTDNHDLIHKAVGWMLREVGNRDIQTEEKFLKTHYKKMPRTMLRYAIEKFPETNRQKYLKGKI